MDFIIEHTTITFFSLGTILMLVLNLIRRRQYGQKGWQTFVFTALLAAVGMAGVRLLAILENWRELLNGHVPSGMSFFGSVFLVPLLMPLFGKRFGLNRGRTLDLCAPCVAGIVGVMRINCWISGCCGGRLLMIHGIGFRPPTQIIDGVWDCVLMIVLMRLDSKKEQEGRLYPLFLVGYGIVRFFIEFLRATEKDWLFLSHGQVFSVVAVIIGVIVLRRLPFKSKRPVR